MTAKTGRGRRRKGRSFELKIIKDLWRYFVGTVPWKPNESPDDGFSPPPQLLDCHLEMKNQEKLNIWAACKQAEDDAQKSRRATWAVVFTRSRTPIYVAIPYEEWKQLTKWWTD